MVEQADDGLTAEGAEKVDLKQLVFECEVGADRLEQQGHQLVDQQAGGRELINPVALLGLLIEHRVVEVITFMPDTEFGAHPIVAGGRGERAHVWGGKIGHQLLQTLLFGF